MFEIVFLGTSASAPSIHRGLTSHIVLHDEYRFLIDCGEGTQRQIMKSGLGFKRLNKILITHGVGNRKRRKGMRLKRTVAGNTVGETTVQVNVKIAKYGKKPILDAPEEAPAEGGDAPKEEAKSEEKPAEEKKPEAPKEEKPEEKKDEKPQEEAKSEEKKE